MKYEKVHSDEESEPDLDLETGELLGAHPVEEAAAAAAAEDAALDGVAGTAPTATRVTTTTKSEAKGSKSGSNKNQVVKWKDLPRKGQLAVLTLARLSEPITQTSLQAYLFYQLKWFDSSLPDATISSQAGILHASFTAAQFFTALLWGRLSESWGRKTVLLFGLTGTCISCLGFAFATSFWQALVFRTIGGALNGNVGVLRTMVSEIIREKKYQSRAFLLLPMTFNIGVVIGPVLGGILSDPAGSYPELFGNIDFLLKFPYAVPNLVSACFLCTAAAAIWLGLEETLEDRRGQPDLGLRIGHFLKSLLRGRFQRQDEADYSPLPLNEMEMTEQSGVTPASTKRLTTRRFTQRLAFKRIFTRNVLLTLVTHFFVAWHIGTFNSLWFIFLSTPVYNPETTTSKPLLPFLFTGGVGLQPKAVGVSLAVLGFIGISMQLFLYPYVSGRLGTIRSLRIFLLLFPLAYFLAPYLAVVPSTSAPPAAKTGAAIWTAIVCVLLVQVTGRTFALPAQTILVNNCSPHPSILGVVHGLGQSVSSAARTMGPMSGGALYGYGLQHDFVGLEFWILSSVAVCAWIASLFVREGDGHEIWLEGDEEE